ncbi:MAG: O-antigen ligase family protein, partial [Vicinamibacterales bacterium]
MSFALRLLAGGTLAALVITAALSPFLPPLAGLAAILTLAIALWRADMGLVVLVALAPAGLLLAPDPARAAEALAWGFLAGWLLRVDRPLASAGVPRAIALPASLYLACAVSSWVAITIADAGGIDPAALPRFILKAIGTDHLWASSPEPETSAMLLTTAGLGVLLASLAVTRAVPGTAVRLAAALGISSAALAGAAALSVLRMWAGAGFALWWLARYPTIERVALHMPDVNAAGSLYALALLATAGLALRLRSQRWLWAALALITLVGLVLAGSRSAMLVALVTGAAFAVMSRTAWRPRLVHVLSATAAVVLLLATVGVVLARGGDEQNNATRALRQRAQFMETTGRMMAASPLLGVGVGRYHSRSSEFMPADLRAIYGYENAHNYFAQQFAELGIIGGVLFAWLMVAAVAAAWRDARGDWARAGLATGVTAYGITCLTGHPLLVPEAALPFWPLLGAGAA